MIKYKIIITVLLLTITVLLLIIIDGVYSIIGENSSGYERGTLGLAKDQESPKAPKQIEWQKNIKVHDKPKRRINPTHSAYREKLSPQECIEVLLPNYYEKYAQYDQSIQFIYLQVKFADKIHPPRKSTLMRSESETDEISRRYMKIYSDFRANIESTQLLEFDMNGDDQIDKGEANDNYYQTMMELIAPEMIQLIEETKRERTELKKHKKLEKK